MQLQVLDGAGQAGTPLEVADSAFGAAFREPLVHQVVVAYMAGGRAGTKAQKTRSEVRGGGAKPWRQKGTGRARAGTIRSPVWRGGGRAFAAKPRDFSQKVNRKSYRAAMRSILSELARQETLSVVDSIALDEPRTKALLARLQALGLTDVLLVTEDVSRELYLASRNLPEVDVRDVHGLDPVSLLRHQRVLMTAGAVRKIEEWLA